MPVPPLPPKTMGMPSPRPKAPTPVPTPVTTPESAPTPAAAPVIYVYKKECRTHAANIACFIHQAWAKWSFHPDCSSNRMCLGQKLWPYRACFRCSSWLVWLVHQINKQSARALYVCMYSCCTTATFFHFRPLL